MCAAVVLTCARRVIAPISVAIIPLRPRHRDRNRAIIGVALVLEAQEDLDAITLLVARTLIQYIVSITFLYPICRALR